MILYPVDFHRRAQQKWARRLLSLRTPVAGCARPALAGRAALGTRVPRNRPVRSRA
jgi:hypothetical protein